MGPTHTAPSFTRTDHVPRTAVEGGTDQQGSYSLETTGHNLALVASKPGYMTVGVQTEAGVVEYTQHSESGREVLLNLVLRKPAFVRGRVVDEHVRPVAGVSVSARPGVVNRAAPIMQDGFAICETGADGAFTLESLFEGETFVTCSVPGYVPFSKMVQAPEENLAVTLATKGGTVSGRVSVIPSGQALPGTTVTLRSVDETVAPATSSTLPAVPMFPGATPTPTPAPPSGPPPQGIVVVPSPRHPGALLRASGIASQTTVTDSMGVYAFTLLPPGKYRVEAKKPPYRQIGDAEAQPPVVLEAGQQILSHDIGVYLGHAVSGRVVVRGGNKPVPGANVAVSGAVQTTSTRSDQNGFFRIDGLFPLTLPAEVRLTAEKSGFSLASRLRGRASAPDPRVRLTAKDIETSTDIVMIENLSISGTVLDGVSSSPLAGVSVMIARSYAPNAKDAERTATGAKGEFVLTAMQKSSIRLRAEAPGKALAMSDAIRVDDAAVSGVRVLMYDGGSVAGTVVDPEDRPIAGALAIARISIPTGGGDPGYTEYAQRTTTHGDGTFAFNNLPTEHVYLDASLKGYAAAKPVRVILQPGERKSGIKLQLRPARRLAGRVLAPDGRPAARAFVNVYSPQDASGGMTHTDDAGRFTIPDLADAPHIANVTHPQHGGDTFRDICPGDKEVELRIGQGDSARARSDAPRAAQTPRPGSLEIVGNVVDYLSAKPIADFEADSSGLTIEKDPGRPGRFTARGARGGYAYSFRIAAPGYALYETPPVFVPRDEKVVERTFKLGPGGTVIGRAVVSGDGKPLAGVAVEMLGATNLARGKVTQLRHSTMTPERTVITAEDGRFSILSESPGTKLVRFIPPAGPYVQMTKEVDVYYGSTSDMGDVPFGSGGAIQGRLLRSPGDVPVADAQIDCQCRNQGQQSVSSTRTAADGTYRFTGLVNGLYHLAVPQYDTDAWVGVEILETKDVDLRFGESSITGHLTRGGAPHRASFRLVRIGYGQSMVRQGQTDSSGTFKVEGLPPGRWQVQLTSLENGSWQLEEFVELLDTSGAVERNFQMPVATLQVTVNDSAGKPVSGARVTVRKQVELGTLILPDASSAVTGDNGQTLFEGLAPGEYSVLAEKTGAGQALQDGVPVTDGRGNTATVRLETGTQGGSLVSVALNMSTGLPVPQAWCYIFRPDGTVYQHGAQRDERGIMTVENIPPGKYLTQVSAYGFSVGEQAVVIEAGGSAQIEDVLYPAGSFRWALKDAAGNPAAGIPCRLAPADPGLPEKVREGFSDSAGMFIARGMMPGAYTATASPPGKTPATATVRIYASNATDEVTQLP